MLFMADALIADAFSADANTDVAPANNIPDGWEGVDIAEEGSISGTLNCIIPIRH